MLMRRGVLLAAAVAAWVATNPAQAGPFVYSQGHGDVAFGYDPDEGWEPHIHVHDNAIVNGSAVTDQEFEDLDEAYIRVPDSVKVTTTATSNVFGIPESLGLNQGDLFFNLFQGATQANSTNSPFLGFETEEIDFGVFVEDMINVMLTGFSGPGQFTLWTSGDGVALDTLDGLASGLLDPDSFTFPVGTHDHFHWAFSAPGLYQITLTASGDLVSGGSTSDTGTFQFLVGDAVQPPAVPEPTSLALLAIGGIGLVGRGVARRRKAVAAQ